MTDLKEFPEMVERVMQRLFPRSITRSSMEIEKLGLGDMAIRCRFHFRGQGFVFQYIIDRTSTKFEQKHAFNPSAMAFDFFLKSVSEEIAMIVNGHFKADPATGKINYDRDLEYVMTIERFEKLPPRHPDREGYLMTNEFIDGPKAGEKIMSKDERPRMSWMYSRFDGSHAQLHEYPKIFEGRYDFDCMAGPMHALYKHATEDQR
jgi:hypothetical protein